MNTIITDKIKLWGIVQGVGFRPFVAKLAEKFQMKGRVLNTGGLVDIILTDTPERIDAFAEALQREKPEPAEIVHIKRERLSLREFDDFKILNSNEGDDEAAMIPADLAICPSCRRELWNPENPRFLHPFISCMVCGPRYTIIDKIPYDRDNTAMIDFPMCDYCHGEYTDLHDRRHHAQTISCHDCGPVLEFKRNSKAPKQACSVGIIGVYGENIRIDNKGSGQFKNQDKITVQALKPVMEAVWEIREGNIVAFKSTGGYNFICDPFNLGAVDKLRELKCREMKPFALMFRDMEQIKAFCYVSDVEERLLESSARPIILLERKPAAELEFLREPALRENNLKEKNICLGEDASFAELEKSRFIGAFLPSLGAQYMLLEYCRLPLIVTSANLSDMPIIKDDAEMEALMEREIDLSEEPGDEGAARRPLISAMLWNGRDIRIRADDSVVRVIDGQPQMIRRSKGYAPVPLYVGASLGKEHMIFATGGQLKNSFALSKGSFSYVSQYFGDLDTLENQAIYQENVERMKSLFRIEPSTLVCDMHPGYYTTGFAESYGKIKGLPIVKVQHHHAHVASVMAEHQLSQAVIGVSFDGTGYGTDGAVWGGEILLCQGSEFHRLSHLKYINMLGGDSSMKEAWKSAMCYIYDSMAGEKCAEDEFSIDISELLGRQGLANRPERPYVEGALKNNINVIKSSSMGRLFDSAAALLDIKDYNDYEGQCAILLEDAAARALKQPGKNQRDGLALDFHRKVAGAVLEQCLKVRAGGYEKGRGVNNVVLTGGVFQNKILMEEALELLRRQGFRVYYNVSVSPNDGGICLGQNYIAMQMALEH